MSGVLYWMQTDEDVCYACEEFRTRVADLICSVNVDSHAIALSLDINEYASPGMDNVCDAYNILQMLAETGEKIDYIIYFSRGKAVDEAAVIALRSMQDSCNLIFVGSSASIVECHWHWHFMLTERFLIHLRVPGPDNEVLQCEQGILRYTPARIAFAMLGHQRLAAYSPYANMPDSLIAMIVDVVYATEKCHYKVTCREILARDMFATITGNHVREEGEDAGDEEGGGGDEEGSGSWDAFNDMENNFGDIYGD